MQEIVAGILMIIIAMALILFPTEIWKWTEAWKHKKRNMPSKAYFLAIRCVGIGFIVCGAIVLVQ